MDRLLSIMRTALADARARGAMDEYAIVLLGLARLQHMSDLAAMTTAHMPVVTPCAWCLSEAGLPMGSGSHGVCRRHADLMVEQSRARRAARLARVA